MPLTREKKQKILEELKEKITKQKAMIFVDFTGLKVKDLSNLRKKIKAVGDELKVAKKTLIRIAFKEIKIEIDPKKMPGEIALIFGYKDEILPAKIVWQFAETNPNLKILGGFFENKFFEADKIIELAKLPTKEEILAKFVWSIKAPILNLINVLQGNIKGLIYILSIIKK